MVGSRKKLKALVKYNGLEELTKYRDYVFFIATIGAIMFAIHYINEAYYFKILTVWPMSNNFNSYRWDTETIAIYRKAFKNFSSFERLPGSITNCFCENSEILFLTKETV